MSPPGISAGDRASARTRSATPRHPITAYLGVGSNIDPERNIPRALRALRKAVTLVAVSDYYETPPLGRPDQPPFYNGAVHIETAHPLQSLKFSVLRRIERRLGRRRTADKFAPRTIDLDVLVYGNEVVHRDELRVPDPDIYRRPFVAIPLFELAPALVLPDSGVPLRDLVAGLQADDMILLPEFSRRLQEEML